MKSEKNESSTKEQLLSENEDLKARLVEAEETIRAIQSGEVDAIIINANGKEQIYTLEGAEEPYRVLFEQMNEGAVTVSEDCDILYSNRSFAQAIKSSLEKVIGTNLASYIYEPDTANFNELLKQSLCGSARGEVTLRARDGTLLPMQLSISHLESTETLTFCIVASDLSERVRAEKALREAKANLEMKVQERTKELSAAEERWSTTLSSIGDAVIATDVSGNITFMNQVAESLTGWSIAEAVGRPLSQAFHIINEITRGEVEDPVTKVLRTGSVVGLANHSILVRRDGAEVPIDDSGSPIRGKEGMVTGVVLIFRDVSERRSAQKALMESEAKYRDLFETVQEVFYIDKLIYDEQGNVIDWIFEDLNPSASALLGFKNADEGRGKRGSEVLGPEVTAFYLPMIEKARLSDKAVTFQYGSPYVDKEFLTSYVVRGDRLISAQMDITEIKKAQRQLEDEKQRLQSLINSISDEVWVADADGKIIMVNPSVLKEFNISPFATGEKIERVASKYEVYRPDGSPRPPEEAPPARALKGEGVVNEEEIVRTPATGELRHRQVSASSVRDDNGKIIGSVSVVRDITDIKMVEQELQRNQAVLEGINRIFHETITLESDDDLGLICLNVVEKLTKSKFGFIGLLNPQGLMDDDAISDPGWEACRIATIPKGHGRVPVNFKVRGIYERVLGDGKAFYTNDPSSHPDSIEVPEGHPPLTAFLGIPLKFHGKVIGMIGLGNKDGGYDDDDLRVAKSLTPSIVQALRRKEAEEGLKASEVKYRTLFESMTEAVAIEELIYGEDGKVIDYIFRDVNPTWERMFRKTKEEAVGRTAKQLFGFVEEYWIDIFVRVVETGRPDVIEQYSEAIDGYFNVNAWKMGEKTVGIGVIDVTEEKRSQRHVEEERARLQAIMDTIPTGFFIVEANGRVLFTNDEAKRIWAGSTPLERASDYSTYKTYWPETGEQLKADDWPAEQALLYGRETRGLIVDIERFDGTRGTIVFSGAPIRDSEGGITGAVVAIQDITELRRKEAELNRSNEELQHFAYISSHDLQEPLRMVTSYLGLLERRHGRELDAEAKEYMSFAVEGAMRMKDLINDLLSYTRVESRGKPFTEVDINQVFEKAKEYLSAAIEANHATVTADNLPIIIADDTQMVSLMQNLLSNAIKFHGDEPPRIHVSCKENWREYTFKIQDNGIGISHQYQEKVFDMFQRLHTRDEYDGTGIGLAVAKKIVERHGGRIWVESEGEGKGTTFYFTIPKSSP